MEKPIFLYSMYCPHSKFFGEALQKHQSIFNAIIRMNIDVNPQTKRRPKEFYMLERMIGRKITSVPSIIIPRTNNTQMAILTDKDAFMWLKYEIDQLNKKAGIEGYNMNEMGSLSDHYSKFGSTQLHDATEQMWKSLDHDKNGKWMFTHDNYTNAELGFGEVPSDHHFIAGFRDQEIQGRNNIDISGMAEERKFFESQQSRNGVRMNPNDLRLKYDKDNINMDVFNNRRQMYNPQSQQQQRPMPNFEDPSLGFGGSFVNSNFMGGSVSQKEKELEDKLQQMMMARQNQGLNTKY